MLCSDKQLGSEIFLYPDGMKWNDSNLVARKYQSTSAVNIRAARRIHSAERIWCDRVMGHERDF